MSRKIFTSQELYDNITKDNKRTSLLKPFHYKINHMSNVSFVTDYFRHFRTYSRIEKLVTSGKSFSSNVVTVCFSEADIAILRSKIFRDEDFVFQHFAKQGVIFPIAKDKYDRLPYEAPLSGSCLLYPESFMVEFNLSANVADFVITGSQPFVDYYSNLLLQSFPAPAVKIRWYHGKNEYADLQVDTSHMPVQEMYPFLQMPLDQFYESYLQSSANILMLIGPPGTGKTTFIRGLLQHAKSGAILTYDPELLLKDDIFVEFMSSEEDDFLILEDSDTFLCSRADGNSLMHRFLNVSNGLVSTKSKKLIFSTNLPSIRDIDSALLRPGRCFDVLHFNTLSSTEMKSLATAMKVEYDESATTLAELLNHQPSSHIKKRSFGFNV